MSKRVMRVTGQFLAQMCRDGFPRAFEVVANALPDDVRCVGVMLPNGTIEPHVVIVVESDAWDYDPDSAIIPELPPTEFRVWMVPQAKTTV